MLFSFPLCLPIRMGVCIIVIQLNSNRRMIYCVWRSDKYLSISINFMKLEKNSKNIFCSALVSEWQKSGEYYTDS